MVGYFFSFFLEVKGKHKDVCKGQRVVGWGYIGCAGMIKEAQ